METKTKKNYGVVRFMVTQRSLVEVTCFFWGVYVCVCVGEISLDLLACLCSCVCVCLSVYRFFVL